MLDHLYVKSKRENFLSQIDENKLNIVQTENNIQNFLDLFELHDKSKESNFKEYQAKAIENYVLKSADYDNM